VNPTKNPSNISKITKPWDEGLRIPGMCLLAEDSSLGV